MRLYPFYCLFVALLSLPISGSQADDADFLSATWVGTADNPLFTGRPGHWDAEIRERGWIMKEGETWKLWYTGYNKADQPLKMRLGYATSSDGIHWERAFDEPVYDEVWTEDVTIVKHNQQYIMMAEGYRDQPHMLESEDGMAWTRIGPLDVRKADGTPIDPGPHGTPTLLYHDNVWHLFYERRDQGIWLATSTDRKVWTNETDEPLIIPGPHEYDRLMIAMNQIVQINGTFYGVMHGTGSVQKPRDWCTYLVKSNDLRRWSKLKRGPLLPVGSNRSSGMLIHDGEQWRLYTAHARVDVWFPRQHKFR